MKRWSEKIEIDAPIDDVWKLVDGSLEEMQKITPNLIENEPVKVTDEGVGSQYKQSFKVGSRFQTFEIEVLQYENQPDYKIQQFSYVHAGVFKITTTYELTKLSEGKTLFHYQTQTKPLKWYLNFFMLISRGGSIAKRFVRHAKKVAEREWASTSSDNE